MKDKSDYKDIIKLHKAWADRYMLLWYLFVVTLFAGISFLLDESSLEAAVKTNAYILLAVIVVKRSGRRPGSPLRGFICY